LYYISGHRKAKFKKICKFKCHTPSSEHYRLVLQLWIMFGWIRSNNVPFPRCATSRLC